MSKVLTKIRKKEYDVTIFQTPKYRQRKGYTQVYRYNVHGDSHYDCLEKTFKKFNVPDRIPTDYLGRFIATGDIIFIDEGLKGQYYYQLQTGGWKEVNRINVR